MAQKPDLSGYIDVAERIVEFRTKHPEGSLQPVDPAQPYRIEQIGERTWIVVTAAAYRTPDDPRPGIGMAWESYPGRTPYTRDSELQNCETSAWGRAIVAALSADTSRGVASHEEVRNRQAERQPEYQPDPDAITEKARDSTSLQAMRTLWAEAGRLPEQQRDDVRAVIQQRSDELKADTTQEGAGQ